MSINVYSTCPPYHRGDPAAYKETVRQVSRWSEDAGCKGVLVYTDNGILDPWLLAQWIVENTATLEPLVAVQPVYMHPYSVAKMVTTFGCLYSRRICLNMVAGGFKNDLAALGDATPHDRRYDRLVEYSTIILKLLSGGAVTFEGEFYRVQNCLLKPALSADLRPLITISGSSAAGRAAAQALDAIAVEYPEPPEKGTGAPRAGRWGIRIGIIAREEEETAWSVAFQRFPPDRQGEIAHALAMKTSDSEWHRNLAALGGHAPRSNYWLVPFETYKTFCPYLVGSYAQVADILASYISAGCETFILDVPAGPADLLHANKAFDRAMEAISAVRGVSA